MKRKRDDKQRRCTAKKGDYPCTIWGCPWCHQCALYKSVKDKNQKS